MKLLTLIQSLVLTLALLAFSSCAHHPVNSAASTSSKNEGWEKVSYPLTQIYLPDGTIDPATAIPAPPKAGTKAYKADFAKLLHYQKTRTSRECARASSEVIPNLEAFYGPKYGPLTEKQVQKWQSFLDGAVRSDSDYVIQKAKHYWNRPRPYLADPAITPCVKKEGTRAYPSGHAAISEVYARILERIYPSRQNAIETRTRQIGIDRVLAGVHHPSDIVAGHQLGRELYRAFMKSPSFRKAFAELRKTKHHHKPAHSNPVQPVVSSVQ